MKAKKKEIEAIAVAALLTEQPIAPTGQFYPPARKGGGIVLEGDPGDLAEQLLAILKEKTTVVR
jgi:electron transfer flavoprotein beta subunit